MKTETNSASLLFAQKQILIEMARNGAERPSCYAREPGEQMLGQALAAFLAEDSVFAAEIRAYAKNWVSEPILNEDASDSTGDDLDEEFSDTEEVDPPRRSRWSSGDPEDGYYGFDIRNVKQMKPNARRDLLKSIAKSGAPRPKHNSEDPNEGLLAIRLSNYLGDKSGKFYLDIREISPDWLPGDPEVRKERRERLLQMAKDGRRRPTKADRDWRVASLGSTLDSLLFMDPLFLLDIIDINPNGWLQKGSTHRSLLKEQGRLLRLAKAGEPKPRHDSDEPCTQRLAKLLRKHWNESETFRALLFEINPDWCRKVTPIRGHKVS